MKDIINIHFKKNQKKYGFEIIPLSVFEKKNKTVSVYEHIHFNALIYFTQGEGVHSIDFNEYKYHKESIIFISSNQIHKFNLEHNYDGFVILFTNEFFNHSKSDMKILLKLTFIIEKKSNFIALKDDDLSKLYLSIIHQEFQHKIYNFKYELLYSLLKTILLQLLKEHSIMLKDEDIDRNIFNAFRTSLEHNFKEVRNVHHYCKILKIDNKELNFIVKKYTNSTVKHYIDKRVILEIKRLLIQNTFSINEISYMLNFYDISNFNKYFKKSTNQTPKQFQKINISKVP